MAGGNPLSEEVHKELRDQLKAMKDRITGFTDEATQKIDSLSIPSIDTNQVITAIHTELKELQSGNSVTDRTSGNARGQPITLEYISHQIKLLHDKLDPEKDTAREEKNDHINQKNNQQPSENKNIPFYRLYQYITSWRLPEIGISGQQQRDTSKDSIHVQNNNEKEIIGGSGTEVSEQTKEILSDNDHQKTEGGQNEVDQLKDKLIETQREATKLKDKLIETQREATKLKEQLKKQRYILWIFNIVLGILVILIHTPNYLSLNQFTPKTKVEEPSTPPNPIKQQQSPPAHDGSDQENSAPDGQTGDIDTPPFGNCSTGVAAWQALKTKHLSSIQNWLKQIIAGATTSQKYDLSPNQKRRLDTASKNTITTWGWGTITVALFEYVVATNSEGSKITIDLDFRNEITVARLIELNNALPEKYRTDEATINKPKFIPSVWPTGFTGLFTNFQQTVIAYHLLKKYPQPNLCSANQQ
ncbi:hypothetical protein TI05_01590 [Achromatium sp. WMS3]|nr:hypothetical protein TI05_01590 [Achromatium sp. WMS3]